VVNCIYKELLAPLLKLLQNWRTASSGSLHQKQNQRTSGAGYSKNLRELGVFHEITGNELVGLWPVILFFQNDENRGVIPGLGLSFSGELWL
jgi:hypothetical protein